MLKKVLIYITAIVLTSGLTQAQDWEWIETGHNFILTDVQFPLGQSQIGYAVGMNSTYNGDGIVLKTTDGGDTWDQLTNNGIPGLEGSCFLDLETGYAAGWGGYMIKTTDGGDTWSELTVASGIFYLTDVEFWDEDHGLTSTQGAMYVTDDGGESWTLATGASTSANMIAYASQNIVLGVGGERAIWRSTNGGSSWTEVHSSGNPNHILLGVYFYDANYGMATGDPGLVLKTYDGGLNWSVQNIGDYLLHTPFLWDQDTAYTCGTPELIFKSTDGGNTFISDYNGGPNKAFYRIIFTNNYTGFVSSSGGVILRKAGFPAFPDIEVTPDELVMPNTPFGGSSEEELTISNNGDELLVVSDIYSSQPEFTVDPSSLYVSPGESEIVTVTFSPPEAAIYTANIIIESDDPDEPVVQVPVTGEGVLPIPAIEVIPAEIVWDSLEVGTSDNEMLLVKNVGYGPLTVSDIISTNAPIFTASPTNFTVEPGELMVVAATFSPTDEGFFEGTLQVFSDDPENEQVDVPVSGTGYIAKPIIVVDPMEITFDTTNVGEITTDTLTILNAGLLTLEISSIASTVEAFTVDTQSLTLEPGDSSKVIVTFNPLEMMAYEGEIQILSNDPDNEQTDVMVQGYGYQPLPAINVTPAEIDFDTVAIGYSASETVVIENNGDATLEVSNIECDNDVFTVDIQSATIEPGESENVEVTFAPLVEGDYTGTLQIESNDPEANVVLVSLSGYGLNTVGFSESNQMNDIRIYPNPFNNSVLIELDIESNEGLTIEIWDINGRQVYTATMNSLQNGNQIKWDGKETNGQAVSPGIYLGRIRTADFQEDFELIKH